MNNENLIKVISPEEAESTGYLFLSSDEKKSFVITSKHSICDQKSNCDLYEKVDECCRTCPKEFVSEKIQLLQEKTQDKLSIIKVFYDKNKDLTIIEVNEKATEKLTINENIYTNSYVARGFNKKDKDWINLDLDKPKQSGSMTFYRHLGANPNLLEKKDNFQGMSGSVVFTYHQGDTLKIAKSIIIHNENHNDFGAENLETLDFDLINNCFECHVFQTILDIESDEFKLLSQKNHEWLLNSFSNNRAAKHSFGQPLAPNDPNLTKLLPRTTLITNIHNSLCEKDIIFILGKEGAGKSWVAAQNWLSLEDRPLHIFLTAQDFSQFSNNDLELFLIKKIIEQTNDEESETSFKKWSDRFKKWGNYSDENYINLLVTIDGINQKTNMDWSAIINKISHLFGNNKVKVLVTSRTIFFNEKVRRKIIDDHRIKVLAISEWSEYERNEILSEKQIDPNSLTDSVAKSLLNPRLLNIALSLFDKQEIQKIDELDINRILLEHIRHMESDNYEDISYQNFLENIQIHAKEIIERLTKSEIEDLNYFKGNIKAVAEGHFFEIVEDDLNLYKLRDESLSFALGLEIILQLNKMKRNGKNLDEGIAKVIEPINALDKTSDIIISCLTILIFESNYYSKEVLSALVSCFVSLQNTDESHLGYFATIVEKKISDFINIFEELCLEGGNQPNFNWVKTSITCIPYTSSSWPCIEEKIKKWLIYYSLSPEKNLAYFSQKDDKNRLSQLDKNQRQITEKLDNLSQYEKKLMYQMIEKEGDIDILVAAAFHILAGKPLINFTLEFIKWSFGYSLNSGFGSADREFKNLIRYNSVDWENTRKKLLIDSQFLNSNDTSNVSKSAYIRILYATGETNDQKLGEKIGNQLWSAERHFLFKSRKEKYCSSDPCDPKSSPPEDFIETIKAVNEIDISKIWNNQMQTSEGIFLHDIQTGLARFSSKELVLIYRKLISNILERSIYGIRYGILNIDQHNFLFNKDHVKKLLDIQLLDKKSERFHGLTEEDKSLIKQFSIILSLPFLSPSQQIEKLLSFKRGEDVFISLIKTMDEITSQEFEELLCRPLEGHQILNLIYYANMKEMKINGKYKAILMKNIFSSNSSIRKETFLAINLYKDLDLLKEFINSKWSINKIGACEHEVFYGSLLWMLSLRMNLVDEETAIKNIAACAFGNTVDYFPKSGLKKISYLLDDLLCVIVEKQLSLPSLEIIEVIPYNNKISLFSIDRKEIDNNFESQMKELSESGKEFQERQRNQHEEFINYKTYLKNNGLEFILRGMLPNSFSKIANSNPKIRDSWFDRCSSLKEQDIPKLYNFILLLAYTYSEIDIQKAQLLWSKVENSESFSKIYIGQEKISLKQMSVWGGKNENLNPYRFYLLDKAVSDEEIYSLVLAAIVNKNDSVIHNYIKQKINKIEPAQIARGVLVAGCLDENYISNEVFSKYNDYKGIIGEAYKASLYMYERNIWSKYWFKKMVSTEDKEEFWRYMILFTKIVDSRFYNWKDSVLNENNLLKNFYQSFRNDINNRCKKWQKERSKKLFGNEPPNPIYIYSQD